MEQKARQCVVTISGVYHERWNGKQMLLKRNTTLSLEKVNESVISHAFMGAEPILAFLRKESFLDPGKNETSGQ